MKGFQAKVLFIPIMPRLRVFKISLQEWTGHGNRPRQLRFETADATQGVKIEYGTQFPVLEKIRVGFSKMGNKGYGEIAYLLPMELPTLLFLT